MASLIQGTAAAGVAAAMTVDTARPLQEPHLLASASHASCSGSGGGGGVRNSVPFPWLAATTRLKREAKKARRISAILMEERNSGSSSSSSSPTSSGSTTASLHLLFQQQQAASSGALDHRLEADELWLELRREAHAESESEPALVSYYYSTVLAHRSLERALAFHLGNKLASSTLLSTQLFSLILDTFLEDSGIRDAVRADLRAVRERDPACISYAHAMLNFKGFLACQSHRVSHRLWNQGRVSLALAIQSRVSEVFHVDIHPAARIGKGVLFDHATGVVVGETATIGNNVSILHHVTLGGTGATRGDRHPKIADGVLIGAGATILGNIRVGECAKIGAGSVVLIDVPPHTTAVGNPARVVGGGKYGTATKAKEPPSETMDHTSWSDYVI